MIEKSGSSVISQAMITADHQPDGSSRDHHRLAWSAANLQLQVSQDWQQMNAANQQLG
jgi:hypothetical protein